MPRRITHVDRIVPCPPWCPPVPYSHRSKTIQNLPPVIFSLMKSTEPWSDEYYSYDLEQAMREAGFQDVLTTEADHRHRVVCGLRA